MNLLKALGKRRDGGGDLCGRTLFVDGLQVKVDTLIGEGGFASIYRVTELKSRGVLALKHFRLGGDPDAVQSVYKEIGLLDELKDCPNTLSLVAAEFSRGEEDAFVLLEHCQQNLATFLRTHPGPLDLVTIISIFQPVCSAIQAMHCLQPPTVHRDVKAENVLLHPEGRWLLCDFGSATTRQQACSSASDIAILEDEIMRNTTPAYRAPEMWDLYSREFIGVQADIWALGCLLYLLCFGRLPFEGEAKLQILNGRYEMHPGVAAPLKELIGGMLTVDVMERWDIHQVQRSVGALGAQLAAEPRLVDQAQVQQEGAALEPRAAVARSKQSMQQQQQQQQQPRRVQQQQQPEARPRRPDPAVPAAPAAGPLAAHAAAREGAVRRAHSAAEHQAPEPSGWATNFEDSAAHVPPVVPPESSGWATFGAEAFPSSDNDSAAAAAAAAAAADVFAMPTAVPELRTPSSVSLHTPTPDTATQVVASAPSSSSAARGVDEHRRAQQRDEEMAARLESALTRIADLEENCKALEDLFQDKVTEVEALKDLVSAKEQQIQALRVQLLEARQPSMNGGINLQQTSLPSHDTSFLGRVGSYSHSRNSSDTPSNSSSPTKAHRSLARSFTTGSNLTPQRCASPMRVPSGSTALSKPATRMQHGRNVSQPACFEQLDPLG